MSFLKPLQLSSMDLQLFTDGSCEHPDCESIRRSTWGVCVADLERDEFIPIARGPLPGLLQTVVRAEYMAAISAVQFALYKQQRFWLWVDNQQVYQLLLDVFHGAALPSNMEPNHDLQVRLGELCMRGLGALIDATTT